MRTLTLVAAILAFMSGCATIHRTAPEPAVLDDNGSLCLYGDCAANAAETELGMEGSGSPGPRGVSLLSILEGQAGPAGACGPYSLTLQNPVGSDALILSGSIRSNVTALQASTTVPMFLFQPANAADANDLLFAVKDSAGNLRFTVDAEGTVQTFEDIVPSNNGVRALGLNGLRYAIGNLNMVQLNRVSLPTCSVANNNEGLVTLDTLAGAATGTATRMCICTSDGSTGRVWKNIVTGTTGTSTTCPN